MKLSLPTVTILVGPSGAGKSTWVKENIDLADTKVCSADFWFTSPSGDYLFDHRQLGNAHSSCVKGYVQHLIDGEKNLVVDNTNTTIAEVAPYIALANAYHYRVRVIFFDTPVEECCKRNIKGVNGLTIHSMYDRCIEMFKEWPAHWPEWEREFWMDNGESTAPLPLHVHKD
jgi:predicted kinase